MHIDLSSKQALITGASSGIGAAIAEVFAASGARVAVHARTLGKAAATLERIAAAGGDAFAVEADLEDAAAVGEMCRAALRGLGGIDIVVNNGGYYAPASVVEMGEGLWRRTMATNLTAPFLVTQLTLPAMIEQGRGGRQLYTSSVSAKIAEADSTAYNASKAGVNSFVRCLALEVGRHGITANAICPGWVDTPMARNAFADMLEEGQTLDEAYAQGMGDNPLGAVIKPADIAHLAAFLASDKGRCITGQAINVCAGLCPTL